MIRMLFGLTLLSAIGCTEIQAVGPFARPGGREVKSDRDTGPPDPVVIPAPTPTPPLCLIRPEDVTANNVEHIKQQLSAEFDADRKNMPVVPVTAEVSRLKDGVKE